MRRASMLAVSRDRTLCRSGFTLLEVVVAMGILLILLISLMGSFAQAVAGFKRAQLMTFAQNLAEFQAEDIKSLAPSVLDQLVAGIYPGSDIQPENPLVVYSNYPYATTDTSALRYRADAASNDALAYMYDSGEIETEFNLIGLTEILGDPYVAGSGSEAAPVLPDGVVLLGPNIQVVPYDDIDTTWKYYRAILHKEAYPQFTKRIQIVRYDPRHLPDKSQHDNVDDSWALYDYTLTISSTQNNVSTVVYSTTGTVGSAYSRDQITVAVSSPAGGVYWEKGTAGAVTWSVNGSTSGIYTYRIRFSGDDGITYGAPLATTLASNPMTASVTINTDTQANAGRIMVEAVSSAGRVIAYGTSAGFSVGTAPPPVGNFMLLLTQPTSSSVWSVGSEEAVTWVTSGSPVIPVAEFLVWFSTDGGATWLQTLTAGAGATSVGLIPSAASNTCVVRVTARGAGGVPILNGVATSDPFVTQSALLLTVTSPTSTAVWTSGVAGTATWMLSRAEPAIASYSISFEPAGVGTSVTASAGATSVSITPSTAAASCRIRVAALDGGGNVLVSGVSAAFVVEAPLSVTVLQPVPGAELNGGTSFTVRWVTSGNRTALAQFRILLSTSGSGGTYTSLATVAAEASSASVTLPNVNSKRCYIRVQALNAGGTVLATGSVGPFEIRKGG